MEKKPKGRPLYLGSHMEDGHLIQLTLNDIFLVLDTSTALNGDLCLIIDIIRF